MKKILSTLLIGLVLLSCKEQKQVADNDSDLLNRIDQTISTAVNQYKFLGKQIEIGQYPQTYIAKDDELITSDSGWWCSGFYPGSLLYLYQQTEDQELKALAEKTFEDLKKEQFNTQTHDLGFMMYCSFGLANKLDPNPEYEKILVQSAESLSTRFVESVNAIRSWNSEKWNHAKEDEVVVIIDNMMNLELLFWASEHTGDQRFHDIAITHANTTLDNHFRADNSSYHQLIYQESDGTVRAKITAQGAADESAWARGQAWGLYGYTAMYRITKDEVYLNQAQKIADFILSHPNLPEDLIPYWDFNAPNIPNEERDSSAAAIIASALIELSSYTSAEDSSTYRSKASTILNHLLTDEYIAKNGENGGFLLKHGVGHKPANSEVDVPLSYGDYYLIEAMIRYKNAFEE